MLLIAPCICIVVAFVVACHTASQTKQSSLAQLSNPQTNNSINYKGVSFTFDPKLTSAVKSETRPQVTDGKPCDIVPEHPGFTLVNYPRSSSMNDDDPEIRIFSIAKFREAMHEASTEMPKVTTPPTDDWASDIDEEVRVLKALLDKQPAFEELRPFLARVRSPVARQFTNFPQMPFLPQWEASQAFFARPKYIQFKNGRGVLFLTQWDVAETNTITNDGLEYAYQGITDDGKYYVYAEFSVKASFLPREDDPEVAAWREKNWRLAHNSKEYLSYLRPIVTRLNALPANQFQPNLELVEQLIQSLDVQLKD
jgi:hypothetical protein